MNKNIGIAIAIIVVLVLGYFLVVSKNAPAPLPQDQQQTAQNTVPTGSEQPTTSPESQTGVANSPITVTYTSSGFSPSKVTIKAGQIVTFVNQSNNRMWVASDPHPSHTAYDGTSKTQHCAAGYTPAPFDECTAGQSYSFTFTKVGTWGYHNHAVDEDTGSVVVE